MAELLAWGRDRGLKPQWIDRRNVLPHFDVLGSTVAQREPGVSREQLVADIRWWRDHGSSGHAPRGQRGTSGRSD